MSNDTHPTTNRHQTLALGGESPEELVALQQREDMRHDGVYSSSIHRLWSIFIKDKNSHVHRESYLAGLSNFCQVLILCFYDKTSLFIIKRPDRFRTFSNQRAFDSFLHCLGRCFPCPYSFSLVEPVTCYKVV